MQMKDRKKEVKKSMDTQRDLMKECFMELRRCLEFYEAQAERIIGD